MDKYFSTSNFITFIICTFNPSMIYGKQPNEFGVFPQMAGIMKSVKPEDTWAK
jgi:hypothetical protein